MKPAPAALTLVLPVLLLACAGANRQRDLARAELAVTRELAAHHHWQAVLASVQSLHARGMRSTETLTLRAAAYREQSMLDDAEADLREALKLDGGYAPAHAALAVVLDLKHAGAEAEGHHRKAVELAPGNASYLNDWGFSLYARGKYPEAVAALRRATELAPAEPRYRNNLGFAYARTGDFTRAEQQFTLAGTSAEAHNNLGFAYETAGNWRQAFEAYSEAVRLDPTSDRARENLAFAARKLDRPIPPELAPRTNAQEERRAQ